MPHFMTLRERIDTMTDELLREPKVFSGVLSSMIEKQGSGKTPARVTEIAAQIEKVAGVDKESALKMAWQTYIKYINPEFAEKHAGELPPWLKKDKDDDKEKGDKKDDKKDSKDEKKDDDKKAPPFKKKDDDKDEKKDDKKAEIEKESAAVFASAAKELRTKLGFDAKAPAPAAPAPAGSYKTAEAKELAKLLGA